MRTHSFARRAHRSPRSPPRGTSRVASALCGATRFRNGTKSASSVRIARASSTGFAKRPRICSSRAARIVSRAQEKFPGRLSGAYTRGDFRSNSFAVRVRESARKRRRSTIRENVFNTPNRATGSACIQGRSLARMHAARTLRCVTVYVALGFAYASSRSRLGLRTSGGSSVGVQDLSRGRERIFERPRDL